MRLFRQQKNQKISSDCKRFHLGLLQLWLPSKNLLGRVEGHGKAGDEEIGKGEADQEVVVDAPQLPVEEHAGDHQQVGEDRHQDDREEDHCLAHIRETDLNLVHVVGLVCQIVGGGVHGGQNFQPLSRPPHHHTSQLPHQRDLSTPLSLY